MAEGFRHLKRERLLSATYWIDLNAMIFGMPRAVFPALAIHLYGGRRRRGRACSTPHRVRGR